MAESRKPLRRVLIWAALLLLSAPLTPALAGSYYVTPVGLTLSPDNPMGEFRLINMGEHTLHVQVEVDRWSQEGNRNVQELSREFIVSPLVAEIPPDGSQIVRLGLRHSVAAEVEQSYRVMFREIPDVDPEDKKQVLLNYSVPVFVAPTTEASLQLNWTLAKTDSSTLLLQVTNTGTVHAKIQIHSLRHDEDPATPVVTDSVLAGILRDKPLTYLLPGATRELKLSTIRGVNQGDRLRLSVDLDAKREELLLTVQ